MIEPELAINDLVRLVALGANDARTPLATLTGFARTLSGSVTTEPEAGYARTINETAAQIGQIVDELALVARIQEGRYQPQPAEVPLDELVSDVRAAFDAGRLTVSGQGGAVHVERQPAVRALTALARAAMRHGALDSIEIALDGSSLQFRPIGPNAKPVLTGTEVREFGAAAALVFIAAVGGETAVTGDALVVDLPKET